MFLAGRVTFGASWTVSMVTCDSRSRHTMPDRGRSRSITVFPRMPKLRITSRTCSPATTSTALRSSVVGAALICALTAQAPPPTLQSALALHTAGLARLGAHDPATLETTGSMSGNKLDGRFHSWHDDQNDRFDQALGPRVERTYRKGDREFIVNMSGNVRELGGSLVARQVTQDFIASGDFVTQPQYDTLLGPAKL